MGTIDCETGQANHRGMKRVKGHKSMRLLELFPHSRDRKESRPPRLPRDLALLTVFTSSLVLQISSALSPNHGEPSARRIAFPTLGLTKAHPFICEARLSVEEHRPP